MERKIGEIFEYNGEWYQCIPDTTDDNCNNCFFQKSCSDITGDCSSTARSDGKSVVFKKLEKIGEPFYRRWTLEGNNKLMQRYKTYTTPLITIDKQQIFYNLTDDLLEIEIKQNKEATEENYKAEDTPLTRLVGRYVNNLIDYTTFEKAVKELYSDKEGHKPTSKEFDLEAAKAGKPVCTRDGRKARIICFDKRGEQPIVALIKDDEEEYIDTFFNNGHSVSKTNEVAGDLMMLPGKKEGWVNVYKNQIHNTFKSAEEGHKGTTDYIKTIKVSWEE